MSNESARCQFVDLTTHMECEKWYQYEEGQKFCEYHRNIQSIPDKEADISKTTIFNGDYIQDHNRRVESCLNMSLPEIALHIKGIEEKIKDLERDRRAATTAKRILEDQLSEEERAALREESNGFKVETRGRPKKYDKPTKSPEEKAAGRKTAFAAWADRLGMKTKDLMLMDDDELAAKIAKYKASKQA